MGNRYFVHKKPNSKLNSRLFLFFAGDIVVVRVSIQESSPLLQVVG